MKVKEEPINVAPVITTTPPIQERKEPAKAKTTLNLNSIFKTGKAEEVKAEVKAEAVTENKPYTEQQLRQAWEGYAQLRKNDMAEYHILTRDFTFSGNTITLPLGNSIEEPLLQSMRAELLSYLREKVGSNQVQLVTELKAVALTKKAYTNKEKFEHLIRDNAALKDLKDRFGLDPDF